MWNRDLRACTIPCRSAEVIITMRNRGSDSYKPADYGRKVIVHRVIRDDGTTQYKIKGADGNAYIHECRGFESHSRQLIFLGKSDCLGCAVLLCLNCSVLASFFLPSHLSLKYVYIHVCKDMIYTVYVHNRPSGVHQERGPGVDFGPHEHPGGQPCLPAQPRHLQKLPALQ